MRVITTFQLDDADRRFVKDRLSRCRVMSIDSGDAPVKIDAAPINALLDHGQITNWLELMVTLNATAIFFRTLMNYWAEVLPELPEKDWNSMILRPKDLGEGMVENHARQLDAIEQVVEYLEERKLVAVAGTT